jgi:hypothetical protein
MKPEDDTQRIEREYQAAIKRISAMDVPDKKRFAMIAKAELVRDLELAEIG